MQGLAHSGWEQSSAHLGALRCQGSRVQAAGAGQDAQGPKAAAPMTPVSCVRPPGSGPRAETLIRIRVARRQVDPGGANEPSSLSRRSSGWSRGVSNLQRLHSMVRPGTGWGQQERDAALLAGLLGQACAQRSPCTDRCSSLVVLDPLMLAPQRGSRPEP